MSAQNFRPPLAGIQSALQQSKARGAELAKQSKTARVEEEDAERAKREQARELMERRKSYGRATKRMGSPSPRRPLAGVQPSGFPSPRGSSSSSALSSMRSNLSADETRPASLAASPLPSRRTLTARPASPSRPASARRVASPQRATVAEESAAAGRKRGAPTGGTPQKGGPKKRPPPPQPEPAAAAGGGSWRPPLAPATGGKGVAGGKAGGLAERAERERRVGTAERRGSGSCEDLLAQFGHTHGFDPDGFEETEAAVSLTFREAAAAEEAAAEAEAAAAAAAAAAAEAAAAEAAATKAEAGAGAVEGASRSPASQMMRGLFDRLPFSRPAMPPRHVPRHPHQDITRTRTRTRTEPQPQPQPEPEPQPSFHSPNPNPSPLSIALTRTPALSP